jgi:MFS family permease
MGKEPLDRGQGIVKSTQKYDLWRNLFNGIGEAGFASSALLVAIRHFGASESAKSLIAGGTSIGFLLAPGFLFLFGRSKLSVSQTCALLMIGTGTGVLLSAMASSVWTYTCSLMLACILVAQIPSLMIHIYSRNYRAGERGRRISGNLMLSAAVGAGTALLIGQLLDHDLGHYRAISVAMFFSCLCTAYFHLRIPSEPLKVKTRGLLKDLKFAVKDRLFSLMLAAWMLMGIGNLITIPLRIEYVANPLYGIDASNTIVLSITLILPLIARVISIPVWGLVFDRFNLAIVRICINLCFLVGLFIYFHTQDLVVLSFASALIGWATGGGTMAWTLWVTKVAPLGREPSYMSIHSFFTGVRGVPAPFVGYWILTTLGASQVAWTSAILIGLSSLIFLRLSTDQRLRAVNL